MRWVISAIIFLSAASAAAAECEHPRLATFTDGIKAVRYIEPTTKYNHGVFGGGGEFVGLEAEMEDGKKIVFRLTDESVFEDLEPRMRDIDCDGDREIWTTRANSIDGAWIQGFGVNDGKLEPRFTGPPVGKGYRWLNPIGIGDYDGDGVLELAYVETPHIGGVVKITEYGDGKLTITHTLASYSNHIYGSKEIILHAVGDVDKDGRDDIIVPTQIRDHWVVLSLGKNGIVERWRSQKLTGKVAGPLNALFYPNGTNVFFNTENDKLSMMGVPSSELAPLEK